MDAAYLITKDNPKKFPLAGYPAEHWVDRARFEDILRHTNVGIEHPFNPNKSYLAAWVMVHNQRPLAWVESQSTGRQ